MSNRDNGTIAIQATATASTSFTSPWFKNPGAVGGLFSFDVTAEESTTAKPTFTVQGRVAGSTRVYNLAQVASTAGVPSVVTLLVYPGCSTGGTRPAGGGGSTGAHDVTSAPLPYQFRVRMVSATTGTVTWAGGVDLIG
jgi:hypothetical protein